MKRVTTGRSEGAPELSRQIDTLRTQWERDRRALNALYTISLACRGATSFRDIFEATYYGLRDVFPLDAYYIALCDATQSDHFRAVLTVDEGVFEYREHIMFGTLTGLLVTDRQPRLFHDLAAERGVFEEAPQTFGNEQKLSRAWVGVPLLVGQDTVGVVSVQSYQAGLYTTADVDLLQALGNVIAVALENANLDQQQRKLSAALANQVTSRTVELAALSAIAAELVLQQPLPTLLDRALDLIVPLLGLEGGTVRLLDQHTNELRLVAHRGFEQDYVDAAGCTPLEGSPLRNVVHDNRPLIITHGLHQEPHAGPAPPFEALLSVPLSIGSRVLGALSVLGKQPTEFDQHTIDLAQAIGNQIAIAIENTYLFDEQKRQIRELDAIGQIGQLVSASFDLAEILEHVYLTLQQLTQASVFYLAIYEPETQIVTNAIFIEQGQRIELDWAGKTPQSGSMTEWITRERKSLLFRDLRLQRDDLAAYSITPRSLGPENEVRSWVGVPLLGKQGESIGVLSLQDYQPNRYDEQTVEFLNQVASHVSLGVQKVRLFEERERQLVENARLVAVAEAHAQAAERQANHMALLNRIAQILSSRLDVQEILDVASQELVRIFGADHTGTVLFDDVVAWGTVVAEYPTGSVLNERIPLLNNALADALLATCRPVCITDTATDPLAQVSRAMFTRLGIVSLMIVPLVRRGQVIGSISLDSFGKRREFTEDEQELALAVAASVASAIENARLFAAEQSARRTADTLREVARVLSSSFDPEEVLQLILRELQAIIAYDTASIMLLDRDMLRIAAYCGSETLINPRSISFDPEQRSAAWIVVRMRQPMVISDTSTSPDWMFEEHSTHIGSWLGVPLIAKGDVLGLLNIDSRQRRHFSARDVEVAQAFANQAALALENARLYEESVTRVEQELEIARRIQSNLFPRAIPQLRGLALDARCIPARETGGDFYDFVELEQQRADQPPILGILIGDASGKSIPGAMLMAIARSIVRSEARDHQTPQVVLRETNYWIAHDVPERSFVALSYATLDLQRRVLTLTNAGQLSPLRRTPDGAVEYLDVPGPTFPLGIVPNTPYIALELTLNPGDLLVFFTDGIVEAKDSDRRLFGFERLEALIHEHGHRSPDELIATVLNAIDTFMDGIPQHDDMTLVAIRVE
jgi:GAF domain-containing protein